MNDFSKKLGAGALLAAVFLTSAPVVFAQVDDSYPVTDPKRECSINVLEDIGLDATAKIINKAVDVSKEALNTGASAVANFLLPGSGGAVSSFLGGIGIGGDEGDKVREPELRKQTTSMRIRQCLDVISEDALRYGLERFQKRLTDQLVDEIVLWIQNGGKPRFITNFKDYLKNAGDVAIGDLALEFGYTDFCSPYYRTQVQRGIRADVPPRFSERASCTLSTAVGNVNAFYNDFRNGGWVGYLELLKPQNNIYGLQLMALEEARDREEAEKEAATLQALAGGGYSPVESCPDGWVVVMNDTQSPALDATTGNVRIFREDAPLDMQELEGTYANELHVCRGKKITTPARTVAAIADISVTADVQALQNKNDLRRYTKAIFDAGVQRLIKEGKGGLLAMKQSLSSQGKPPQSYDEYRDDIAASQALTPQEKAALTGGANLTEAYGGAYTQTVDIKARLLAGIRTDTTALETFVAETERKIIETARAFDALAPKYQELAACEGKANRNLPLEATLIKPLDELKQAALKKGGFRFGGLAPFLGNRAGGKFEDVAVSACAATGKNLAYVVQSIPLFEAHLAALSGIRDDLSRVAGAAASPQGEALSQEQLVGYAGALDRIRTELTTMRDAYAAIEKGLNTRRTELEENLKTCNGAGAYFCPAA